MNMSYLYHNKCPYCSKDIEIQLITSRFRIELTKEEDTLLGRYGYICRKYKKELSKKKLVKKLLKLKKAIYDNDKNKRGISYKKLKSLAENIGIRKKEDFDLVIKNLEFNFDVCRLTNGNFHVITL